MQYRKTRALPDMAKLWIVKELTTDPQEMHMNEHFKVFNIFEHIHCCC